MFCAIWYHLHNLKNVLKTATLLKVTLLHECFSLFLNCTNGTESLNAPQFNVRLRESNFQIAARSHFWSLHSKMFVRLPFVKIYRRISDPVKHLWQSLLGPTLSLLYTDYNPGFIHNLLSLGTVSKFRL